MIPGIDFNATLSILSGWFSGWDLGSSIANGWTFNF
jgi:hypothetical protein